MTIHGILAALLGSTALGGFAPLTLLEARRYYFVGQYPNTMNVLINSLHIPLGHPAYKGVATDMRRHTQKGYHGGAGIWATQHIIMGFYGVMPTHILQNTLIQEVDYDGYGFDYGESYGA